MRILIIKFRNIGDVLLATPLIENLKLNYPNARIDFALNKETEDMITLNPHINEVLSYDRKFLKSLPFFKRIKEEAKFLSEIKKNYDLVINLTEGERGAFYALVSGAETKMGIPPKRGFLKNAYDINLPKPWDKHMVEASLDPLKKLGLKIFNKRVSIYWSKKDETDYENFIHIHPVSRWLFKCVKDETIAKIIDFLQTEMKERVVLTAANDKKEMQKINKILSLCKSDPVNLSGKLTLKQTAALSKKAKLFIGVDTAIMHIAAANDTPVIAFFGPSSPKNWGPWDNFQKESGYKREKGIQRMGKHTVIQEEWECVPCHKDGCEGSKISDCLMNLNIDKIKEIIKEKL